MTCYLPEAMRRSLFQSKVFSKHPCVSMRLLVRPCASDCWLVCLSTRRSVTFSSKRLKLRLHRVVLCRTVLPQKAALTDGKNLALSHSSLRRSSAERAPPLGEFSNVNCRSNRLVILHKPTPPLATPSPPLDY